jgi:RimJ/RimL family protein N-acetyltransferase
MIAPTFSHEGMSFRVVQEGDLEAIAELRNDYSTWTNLTDPRPVYPGTQKDWLAGLSGAKGRIYFVAYDRVNPFIGLVRMDEHDAMNASIRVGADVVSGLRGRGYGRKIYEAIKKYCFHYLNVHRVWLLVLETNKHARRLYKKQGFRVEGKQRKAIFRDGEYLDYVMMSILEDEYRGGK